MNVAARFQTAARSTLHLKIAKEIERRSANRLPEVAETLANHYASTSRADKAFHCNARSAILSLTGMCTERHKSVSVANNTDSRREVIFPRRAQPRINFRKAEIRCARQFGARFD